VLNGAFIEIPWQALGFYNAETKTLQYWGTGDEKLELTTYNDVANFSPALALDQGASGYYNIRGDSVSINEIAEIFEKVFKFKPTKKSLGTLDELCKAMHGKKEEEPQEVWGWLSMFYIYYSLNGQTLLEGPLSNGMYEGLQMTSLKEYFEAVGTPEKLGVAYDEVVK
jgi:hypothetical protein